MALKDRIQADISRVFFNPNHFAEKHLIGDVEVVCVVDNIEGVKRKSNNVAEISWDSNTDNILVFVPVAEWPSHAAPQANQRIYFDRRQLRIMSVTENAGVYEMLISTRDTADVGMMEVGYP